MGGSGVFIYQGLAHGQNPQAIEAPWINFVVLGTAFTIGSVSWRAAFSRFRETRGKKSWWKSIVQSKNPCTFVILLKDCTALFAIIIAACAIALSVAFDDPRIDGAGLILIGFVLALVAVLLARESKGLLIGELADPELNNAISAIAQSEPGVCDVIQVVARHLAPEQVIAAAGLHFDGKLNASKIEIAVINIKRRARAAHNQIQSLFVRPQAREVPENID